MLDFRSLDVSRGKRVGEPLRICELPVVPLAPLDIGVTKRVRRSELLDEASESKL